MFAAFVRKAKLALTDKTLLKRILFVLMALALFRLLAAIPIPGVDVLALEQFFANNQFLGLLNIFSGGGLSNLSIVMLGVGPYITASIIMQLSTVLSPKLKAMFQEEGEAGRARFTQYSRYLTVPLAFVQAVSFLLILRQSGIITDISPMTLIVNTLVVASGSIFLMWLGEIMTEFGVGNGVSLIIFAGIVARLPAALSQIAFTFDVAQVPTYLAFIVVGIIVIAGVVYITEAERPIPVTYARRVRGNKVFGGVSTYLPFRVVQAGVIPIIFALSLLLFPQMVGQFMSQFGTGIAASIGQSILSGLSNNWLYGSLYFLLVVLFTYVYTAITVEPHQIAKNLQKTGAFISGVRPGQATAEYLGNVITRITLVGALFLGIIAVLPIIVQAFTGIGSLTIGGTALLIAVTVVLDVVKKIDAQTSIREY